MAALSATVAFGQTDFHKLPKPPVDSLTGKINYNGNVLVLSDDYITSKEELFSRALAWFNNEFPAPMKYTIQIQDEKAGKIEAKALIHYSFGPAGDPHYQEIQHQHEYIGYTITINIRDGGYQYVMTNFTSLTEKAGREIDKHGFPVNPDRLLTESVDSVKADIMKCGEYNMNFKVIASTAENKIASLKKAMAK